MGCADGNLMAVLDVQPRLRRALFGGVRREDAEALQASLALCRAECSELRSGLESARLALGESAGWSERLPLGLRELASLAAGDLPTEDAPGRLGAAVLAVGGEHLLAEVQVSLGDPTGQLDCDTSWNENGRPVRTTVGLGGCVVDCVWQPGVEAGPDTARVVEGLCSAVMCSLAGVAVARVERDPVTQLGDERSCVRHEALWAREQQPVGWLNVTVDEHSQVAYQKLYGATAWDAALARVAAELDRVARTYGGQAYQVSGLGFRLLVDEVNVGSAAVGTELELAVDDGLIFHLDVP